MKTETALSNGVSDTSTTKITNQKETPLSRPNLQLALQNPKIKTQGIQNVVRKGKTLRSSISASQSIQKTPIKIKSGVGFKPVQIQSSFQKLGTTKNVSGLKANLHSKVGDKNQIQSRLKKKSPWFDSLMEPITGADVKIPDPVGIETGTFMGVQEVALIVNPQGVAGLKVITPFPNSASGGVSIGQNYQVVDTTGTAASLLWGNGTLPTGTLEFSFSDLIRPYAQGIRVVSAALYAYSETSNFTNQGEFVAWQLPWKRSSEIQGYNAYTTFYGSSIGPLADIQKDRAIKTLYYPINLARSGNNGSTQEMGFDYDTFVDPLLDHLIDDNRSCPSWEYGLAFSGCEPGTPIHVRIVCNYEYIPLLNVASIITTSPSPKDETEHNLVMNWMEESPKASMINITKATQSPTPSKVEEEPSGFGMLTNVVSEILPFIPSLVGLLL